MEPSDLALFWAGVLVCSILLYVFLDGFDLGVGVLFGTTRNEAHRVRMMNTIAPFWDGNETWLVVIGAGLFAAFPDVYAVFLGAFYFPVLLMLLGLIFRGIAFEFRFRSERMRPVWDWGFFLGSTVVAFVQGAAVGAMMRGIPVTNGQYAGERFGWLHPFAILTGIGLVLGYALLGAGWLVLKSEGELREWAHRRLRWLAIGVFAVLFLAFTVTFDYSILARSNLYTRPWAFVFNAVGVLALARIAVGAESQRDGRPFVMTGLFFSRLLPEPRRDVLAVHDSLLNHGGGRRGAGRFTAIPILRRDRGLADHRRLHDRRLLGLPRQGSRQSWD
jgi:cytochrome d ubiquinol oxidase subunit II